MKIFNYLDSGTCACPGQITGKIKIYNKSYVSNLSNTDILVVLDYFEYLPTAVLKKVGAVICCKYTDYSHFTSVITALNIPSLVGAKFNEIPVENTTMLFNSFYCALYKDNFNQIDQLEEKYWINKIQSICMENFFLNQKTLLYVQDLDLPLEYFHYVNGLFLDSTIFREELYTIDILISKLIYLFKQNPNLAINYRFSPNIFKENFDNSLLKKEIKFAKNLIENNLTVNLFVENVKNVENILIFRKNILDNINDKKLKLGIMVENKNIVENLKLIMDNNLIDFGVIGMNDLLKSYLNLDRDNPESQKRFNLCNPLIIETLRIIKAQFEYHNIPIYISYPKYANFIRDYDLLCKIGYQNYFCNSSLLNLILK